MPRVVLLTTGGTIATTSVRGRARTAPTLSGPEVAGLAGKIDVELETRELSRAPSWSLDPSEMASIAVAARDCASDPNVAGVVVTHGTTTLEYTAFLCSLVHPGPTPIVLTGAMRRADQPDADGPANLADAIRVAISSEARDRGPLVVFAGRIIAGGRAWKAHRTETDAFVDLGGTLGAVTDGVVEFHGRTPPRHAFSGRIDPGVALVKLTPGADERALGPAATGVRGLVLEALPGVGGLPPKVIDRVATLAAAMPVVIAPRSPYDCVAEATGGTGEPLRHLGLMAAGCLTAEQAWLLLMAALADGTDDRDVRDRFRQVAVGQATRD